MELFDIVFKVFIVFLLFIIFIFTNIVFWLNSDKILKKYSTDEIVTFIKNSKNVENIIIFGYSLSFIENLRFHIDETKYNNLTIKIFHPSFSFIETYCEEEKPISTRIEILKGRLHEWENLQNNNRIKKLSIIQINEIPIEYGIIIDNETAFVSNYNWELINGKLKLNKQPRTSRDMFKISQKNKDIWSYFYSTIKLKEFYKS